nr:heme-binding protein [Amycolatopsis circi]
MAVGGGYPIMENGRCIGGLGVSGGSDEQDQEAPRRRWLVSGSRCPVAD